MLSRLEIENYRGFKSYEMEGLAQVNLFVGQNNSGKTSLLEGIQFLASGGDAAVLAEAAERRGELVVKRQDDRVYPGRGARVDIAHFFYGHTLTSNTSMSFCGDNGYLPVTATVMRMDKNLRLQFGEEGSIVAGGLGLLIRAGEPAESHRERLYRLSREGGVDFDGPQRLRRPGVPRRSRERQVLFVGTDSLDSVALAAMWDEITIKGEELDVAAAMRVLDPDLESVHFLTGMLSSGYVRRHGGIVVGMKGQDTRVPLGSLGDGMRRLMSLAASLAFTREGSLFIDEIDTGLHYSVMTDMWKLVIGKAAASGTQVFATTHSWDCIEGLSQFCDNDRDLASTVAIHKIDRAIPHSIAFPGNSVVRMIKSDIDPR
jgi:hypothetical protein